MFSVLYIFTLRTAPCSFLISQIQCQENSSMEILSAHFTKTIKCWLEQYSPILPGNENIRAGITFSSSSSSASIATLASSGWNRDAKREWERAYYDQLALSLKLKKYSSSELVLYTTFHTDLLDLRDTHCLVIRRTPRFLSC